MRVAWLKAEAVEGGEVAGLWKGYTLKVKPVGSADVKCEGRKESRTMLAGFA